MRETISFVVHRIAISEWSSHACFAGLTQGKIRGSRLCEGRKYKYFSGSVKKRARRKGGNSRVLPSVKRNYGVVNVMF